MLPTAVRVTRDVLFDHPPAAAQQGWSQVGVGLQRGHRKALAPRHLRATRDEGGKQDCLQNPQLDLSPSTPGTAVVKPIRVHANVNRGSGSRSCTTPYHGSANALHYKRKEVFRCHGHSSPDHLR